jgi:1,6-anhydro-N-acetylmuramate kinase
MSGTSMDGLDCGLFEISLATDYHLNWEFIDYNTVSYSKKIRESICNTLLGEEDLIE